MKYAPNSVNGNSENALEALQRCNFLGQPARPPFPSLRHELPRRLHGCWPVALSFLARNLIPCLTGFVASRTARDLRGVVRSSKASIRIADGIAKWTCLVQDMIVRQEHTFYSEISMARANETYCPTLCNYSGILHPPERKHQLSAAAL